MADKLRKYKSLYSSTTNTFSTGESVTITPASVVGLPTDTEITLTFDRVDSSGTKTPSKMERIRGTIVGSNFVVSSGGRAVEGTEQTHTSPVVEMVWNADDWNDIVDWGLVEHGQDGKHTDALVTTFKATGAEVNTGTEDAKIVTPKAIADSTIGKAPATASENVTGTDNAKYLTPLANVPAFLKSLSANCIINGGFTVNQRTYVSNATLAAGAYGHDRWKAGASGGDYTFTQLAQATTITIKAGKSLIQVIEDKNVIGGTYTLSWTGTAQARFGINSATPSGAYAASPITITTQTAGTVMSVEFNEGTLGQVNLANSNVALPFMPKSYEEELRACQRYYEIIDFTLGKATSTSAGEISGKFMVAKRIAPAATTNFIIISSTNNLGEIGVAVRSFTTISAVNSSTVTGFNIAFTGSGSLTSGNLLQLSAGLTAVNVEL